MPTESASVESCLHVRGGRSHQEPCTQRLIVSKKRDLWKQETGHPHLNGEDGRNAFTSLRSRVCHNSSNHKEHFTGFFQAWKS